MLKGLSLVDGRDLQGFTILCNGAARHHDALLADKLDRQVLRYKDKRNGKDKGFPRPGNGEEQP